MGIDCLEPAFSWSFEESEVRSILQSAYRIMVSAKEENIHEGIGDIWDSGKVDSRRNINVLYKGQDLKSRKRYFWKVQVWDQLGNMTESRPACWEMGFLSQSDWKGKWIQQPINDSSTERPLPLFRHEFIVNKPIDRARLYICGLGQYELRLNGCKVDDRVLDPGWTHYDKACLYSVFDVTSQVNVSSNCIGVMLGNGFYNVTGGRYVKFKGSYGDPKCIVQLEIDYTDGTTEMIFSNTAWLTSPGPITFSCIYGGEDYDARLEQPGWDQPAYTLDESWQHAVEAPSPEGLLKSQKVSPLKIMKTFTASNFKEVKPNVYLVDLGQNFSGWVNLEVKGTAGSSVKITPAELLNPDGTANQTWTGSPYEFNYILKGEETEVWQPKFTYYGFRYLQIEGAVPLGDASEKESLPLLLSVEGEMIYPDLQVGGSFESSDELLNKTHEIINWAILSNMKSLFTDCPHREKLGWLEQVHLMGPAILYNYPVEPLFTKILEDIQDAQLDNGMVPTTAPEYVVFEEPWDIFRHSVSWGATYILVPWMMYQKYGNTRVLQEHYENMKRYVEFILERSENYIVKDGLGDWYDVGPEGPGFAQNTPVPLPETAMFYHIVQVLEQVSSLINRPDDATHYKKIGKEIKDAYNSLFFHPMTGQYATGSQAANAMSLALGLTEDVHKPKVLQNLLDDIHDRGFHTTSGDVAFRFVLLALSQNGRSDIIYRMTRNTDYPSYGYQIEHGATTLTEAWDGPTVGKSQNHFMLGHIEEWLYKDLAGLDYEFDQREEMYKFNFHPSFVKGLDFVRVTHELYTGKVRTEWVKVDQNKYKLLVQIPANGIGYIHLPSCSMETLKEAGYPALETVGVELDRYENGCAILRVSSGLYEFENIQVSMFKEEENEHPTIPNTF
ncbi:family 78 glycoside hydrolase catalytic domain [Mesobacillus foraminis]|nr:family 78 glycoside hydrolase catalytic domain [Mesobacillus foraminis]